MNMVERVARAICCPEGCRGDTGSGKPCNISAEDVTAMVQARAAIEAMREPTKEMVEAGYDAIHDAGDYYNYDSGSGYTVESFSGARVLRAMIDAALKEGKE